MIPDEEAQTLYTELRDLLSTFGFKWILDNVDELEHHGIQETYSLERYRESQEDENTQQPSQRRESVIGKRTYSEQERLTLLLDEIDRCIIHPVRIANMLPKQLSPTKTSVVDIDLVDNATTQTVFRISASKPVGGSHVADLAAALDQIRSKM